MSLPWGLLFILADVVIAAALVALLSRREPGVPRSVAWMLPLQGKWAWLFLVGLVTAAYLGLAPVALGLWIHNFRK